MPRKAKPPKKDGPTAVAAAAGCTKSTAHKLMKRGLSREQIVERVRQRKKREELEVPVEPAAPFANGHAASAIPSYAVSQQIKEYHLAELRGIEVQIRRRELYPLEPLRSICLAALKFLRVRFVALPDELRDEFGVEHAALLRVRIEGIFNEAGHVAARECEKYGELPASLHDVALG